MHQALILLVNHFNDTTAGLSDSVCDIEPDGCFRWNHFVKYPSQRSRRFWNIFTLSFSRATQQIFHTSNYWKAFKYILVLKRDKLLWCVKRKDILKLQRKYVRVWRIKGIFHHTNHALHWIEWWTNQINMTTKCPNLDALFEFRNQFWKILAEILAQTDDYPIWRMVMEEQKN